MTPHETDVLLQYGVTKPTIDALVATGRDNLQAIMSIQQEQMALIPGVAEADVRGAVRVVGMLADAGYSTDAPHINSISANPRETTPEER